jgi:quercetin dioxygenase-like cupin family protein
MAFQVRRVVTGHDADGKAVALIDDVKTAEARRPGTEAAVIWTTEGFPVNNDGSEDDSARQVATTHANGTVFRVIEFGPGNSPRNHRTDSIDYAVVISGEIDMEMDGSWVHLHAGDVLVQRGTIHNWVNQGTEPCVIAFVLVDAKAVEVGGKVLAAEG